MIDNVLDDAEGSVDREALANALAGMTDEKARTFIETSIVTGFETNVTLRPVSPTQERILSRATGAATNATTRCWVYTAKREGVNSLGGTINTWHTTLKWCSPGKGISSAKVVDADGETSTPGWRYEGKTGQGVGIVNGEARGWSKHKFVLGSNGWDVQTVQLCARANGTYSWKHSTSSQCSIY